MCGIFPWSKRYPDCPPTWLSWEQMSHDLKWDKLWMREDWLSGGRQSPSQFIWHGYLGNKAVRQEAEKRCKLLFVWITATKLPVLQASREYAISLKILKMQRNAYLSVFFFFFNLSVTLPVCSIHQVRKHNHNLWDNVSEQQLLCFALQIKTHNYLTSNNKVNGLALDDVWRCPTWLILTFDLDHTENGADSLSITVTAHILMGAVISLLSAVLQVPLAVSHPKIQTWSPCVIYFMLVWQWGLWGRFYKFLLRLTIYLWILLYRFCNL